MRWLRAVLQRMATAFCRRYCPPPQPIHEMDDLTLHVWCQREIRRIEAAADTGEERAF